MMRRSLIATGIIGVLLLTACGGGSSDGEAAAEQASTVDTELEVLAEELLQETAVTDAKEDIEDTENTEEVSTVDTEELVDVADTEDADTDQEVDPVLKQYNAEQVTDVTGTYEEYESAWRFETLKGSADIAYAAYELDELYDTVSFTLLPVKKTEEKVVVYVSDVDTGRIILTDEIADGDLPKNLTADISGCKTIQISSVRVSLNSFVYTACVIADATVTSAEGETMPLIFDGNNPAIAPDDSRSETGAWLNTFDTYTDNMYDDMSKRTQAIIQGDKLVTWQNYVTMSGNLYPEEEMEEMWEYEMEAMRDSGLDEESYEEWAEECYSYAVFHTAGKYDSFSVELAPVDRDQDHYGTFYVINEETGEVLSTTDIDGTQAFTESTTDISDVQYLRIEIRGAYGHTYLHDGYFTEAAS